METKAFYLRAFKIASNLNSSQLDELCASAVQKEAKKNQLIYARGGDKNVYILIDGKIKISEIDASGDEMIKELILPGDLFGDVVFNSEGSIYEFAEVISDRATYYCIKQKQLAILMRSNHTLTLNYLAKVSEKFKSLEYRYVNMVNRDVKSRLLFCFREWAQKEGRRCGDKIIVKNSLTHGDLANLISTSRQTVTVILNELKEAGALDYNRKQIEFTELMLANHFTYN